MKFTKHLFAFMVMATVGFSQRPAVWAPSEDVPDSPVTSPSGINSPQVAYGSGPNQIKGTDAFTYTEGTGVLRINSTSTAALRGMTAYQYSATTDSAKYNGLKARGTATSPTVITTGDFLTRWSGWGYDGSNFIESASIGFGSTGTIAATRVPSFITFQTGTNASPTVMTESFRVEADQSIRVPNTNTAGIQLYNTADQTTNYERLETRWSGNIAYLSAVAAGSGTQRSLAIGLGSLGTTLTLNTDFANGRVAFVLGSSSSTSAKAIASTFTSTATSGTIIGGLSLTPTYNQASGTAANTDLDVTRTETAVGSGVQRLLNLGTAALGSQFAVNNRGGVSVSYQSLSGAGAVNVTNYSTEYTSTGGAQALTLADGTAGQIKVIVHGVDGGSGVLTPTTKTGFSTVTFTNAGDSVTLQFFTTRGWIVIGSYGAVIAP